MVEVTNLDAGEARTFENGTVRIAKTGSITVSRATFRPGWRWSNDVKPIAGTDSCMVHHKGVTISGRLHVVMDDGEEFEIGLGDVSEIRPGHDAWVVGDEPWVGIDFSDDMEKYARPS
ncbi:MAG TPA: cupin domain-containing protein [Actinomycetota bacterium]|nr:cupin domain-containing protein [Actinomycetota bacterium]